LFGLIVIPIDNELLFILKIKVEIEENNY